MNACSADEHYIFGADDPTSGRWAQQVSSESIGPRLVPKVNPTTLDDLSACTEPRGRPSRLSHATPSAFRVPMRLSPVDFRLSFAAPGRGERAPRVQDGRRGRVDGAGRVSGRARPRG